MKPIRTTLALTLLATTLTACGGTTDTVNTSDGASPTATVTETTTPSATPSETATEKATATPSPEASTNTKAPETPKETSAPEKTTEPAPAPAPKNPAPPVTAPAPVQPPAQNGGAATTAEDVTQQFLNTPQGTVYTKMVKNATVNADGSVTLTSVLTRPANPTNAETDPDRDQAQSICSAAVAVFRGDDGGPRIVKVLDKDGVLFATNTPKNKPYDTCSWV